jgi:hypothetical protein
MPSGSKPGGSPAGENRFSIRNISREWRCDANTVILNAVKNL